MTERPSDKYWISLGTPVMIGCIVFVALFAGPIWMHIANSVLIGAMWWILSPLFAADMKRMQAKQREKERRKRLLISTLWQKDD